MCNKVGYETRKELRAHFKATFARQNKVGAIKTKLHRLTPYLCQRCGLWHMTSLSKSVIKRRYKDKK